MQSVPEVLAVGSMYTPYVLQYPNIDLDSVWNVEASDRRALAGTPSGACR